MERGTDASMDRRKDKWPYIYKLHWWPLTGWTIWKPADIHTHVLSIVKLRMMIVCSATEHRGRNSKSFIKSFLQKLKRNQPQSLAIITSQKPLW